MAHAMIKSILVSEVVRMIAEKFQLPEEEAMDQFYTSGTAEALSDDETG
ncbi:MAG: hypothetical protein LUH58_08365 [Lachnospiraceae bacterium]|nr:hypothetical protein [Lachnospiraceae bacterium]